MNQESVTAVVEAFKTCLGILEDDTHLLYFLFLCNIFGVLTKTNFVCLKSLKRVPYLTTKWQ